MLYIIDFVLYVFLFDKKVNRHLKHCDLRRAMNKYAWSSSLELLRLQKYQAEFIQIRSELSKRKKAKYKLTTIDTGKCFLQISKM